MKSNSLHPLAKRAVSLLLLIAVAISLTACDEELAPTVPEGAPTLEWSAEELFSELPAPITEYGRVIYSANEKLELELYVTQKSDFSLYVQNAVARGYTASVKNSEFFYSATNAEGYKFSAQYKESQKLISVTLDASGVLITAGISSEHLLVLPYFEVVDVLKARGFTKITPRVIAVDDSSEFPDYTVESVTVDSQPITPETLISRSAEVVVKYYKRNVTLAVSADQLVGMHYLAAEAILCGAGFSNVIYKEIQADPSSSLPESANDTVTEISINGRSDFAVGEVFSPVSIISITYVSLDLTVDTDSESYKYADPEETADALYDKGFKNVEIKFSHDYSLTELQTNDGKIAEVTADGKPFSAGDTLSRYADIVITYYQYKVKMEVSAQFLMKSTYYTDAIEYLKELGFVNVEAALGQQLLTGWIHSHGEISGFTINGLPSNFVADTYYPYDAKIIVKYYYDPNY